MPKRILTNRTISDIRSVSRGKMKNKNIFERMKFDRPYKRARSRNITFLGLRSGILATKKRRLFFAGTERPINKKLIYITVGILAVFLLLVFAGYLLSSRKDRGNKNSTPIDIKPTKQENGTETQESNLENEKGLITYEVTNEFLNIRSGPGTEYDIIGELHRGDIIRGKQVEGRDWIIFKTENRRDGYVSSNFVKVVGESFEGEIDVPILMYHYVGDDEQSDLAVSKSKFEEQMKYLHENGFHTITFQDIYNHFKNNEALSEKSIILSFDDGYKDVYDNAFPILKKYNFVGSFSIITDFVGQDRYMNWDQVRELKDAGMEITSHTKTHPDLTTLSNDIARSEIFDSKKRLQEELDIDINFFVYPAGSFDERIIELLKSAGYLGARSTESGTKIYGNELYKMPQLRILGSIDIEGFKWLVNMGKR